MRQIHHQNPQAHLNTVEAGDSEIDIMAIFNVIWRGKLWIIMCALIGFILAGFYAFRIAIPLYPASAIIQLNAQSENVVDIQSVVSDTVLTGGWADEPRMGTEMIAMKSRTMMSKLIDHLDLMENPNYNPSLTPDITANGKHSFWSAINPKKNHTVPTIE